MIIPYLRSSSFNNWDYCQLQFYITYVLGWAFDAGQKAYLGTIAHKVLECLANANETIKSGKNKFDDELLGEIKVVDWLVSTKLSEKEIQVINKSRNKTSVFKTPYFLYDGHQRSGAKFVNELIDRAYEYYSKKTPHFDWRPYHKKDCENFVWVALEYNNGQFDPRKRDIVAAEPFFDIEIKRPWAEYTYRAPGTGEILSGNLSIKGTIDLVTKLDDETIEIIDWKTGQRLNWATGKPKTYDDLCKDSQLLLYYYAASHLYPAAKQIMITIFFIRDGGPFSICFEPEQIHDVEEKLRKRFEEIKNSNLPKPLDISHRDFRCNKLCPFFKNKFNGDSMNICDRIYKELNEHDLEYVNLSYSNPNHDLENYQAPGE